MVQDAQDRTGVLPAGGAVHQQQGLQAFDLQARLLQQGLTGAALTRWYVAEYLRLNHLPIAGHEGLLA